MAEHRQFIETVKQAMKQARYSGRELAMAIGVNPSYITRVLAGTRNSPSAKVVEDIARVLQLNPDRLFMEAGKLPVFLRAKGPLTDKDLKALRRAYDRITAQHNQTKKPAKAKS